MLSPAEKLVPFPVPFEFLIDIELQRLRSGELIDLHRMVDDQIAGNLRVDLAGVAVNEEFPKTNELFQVEITTPCVGPDWFYPSKE